MHASRSDLISNEGLLYPLMWICAIAVIMLSVVGIVSISGWISRSPASDTPSIAAQSGHTISAPSVHHGDSRGSEIEKAFSAFQCAQCGVIDSVRDIEASMDAPARAPTSDAR